MQSEYRLNFFLRMTTIKSFDLEMGKQDLRDPKFKKTKLIKWFIFLIKVIQKRCVHFPLILILCLLFSDAYPDFLSITDSLIMSLIITFIIF